MMEQMMERMMMRYMMQTMRDMIKEVQMTMAMEVVMIAIDMGKWSMKTEEGAKEQAADKVEAPPEKEKDRDDDKAAENAHDRLRLPFPAVELAGTSHERPHGQHPARCDEEGVAGVRARREPRGVLDRVE